MTVGERYSPCADEAHDCLRDTDHCATAQLNLTTETSDPTTIDVLSEPVQTSTWKPKVHGESSADGWGTTTTGSNSKVRLEPTATVLDVTPPLTTTTSEPEASSEAVDIGSAIEDLITSHYGSENAKPLPTVHWENSAPAWEVETLTVHRESSATSWVVSSTLAAHFESSADGWADDQNQNKAQSSRYVPIDVTDNPWTRNVKTPQVTGAGTAVDRQPQVTTIPSRIITDFPAPPPVTYDGITIEPTAVTLRPTVTAQDGSLTTTDKVEFQVAIRSSMLSVGSPFTINDVVVSLTTDTAGSTVLHVGDLTTTLPKPTAGEVRTVANPGRISIATSVIGGTTKYLLAGQTLAPGQPVTIGDTPISVAVDGDRTVLVVGERTTTLAATDSDIQTITDWGTVSVSTQGTIATTGSADGEPTNSTSGSSQSTYVNAAFACYAICVAMLVVSV